ncbi:phage distal tail protein [Mycolicibacterium neoaurum]|uniref:phage distal tail protein n=1 Tax=Mycolicibacterium neoaurum TaxID=1795 RepID=UPI001F4C9F89|nr:phage tail domain-containing protein [Mycolicibacterium neoaurum]
MIGLKYGAYVLQNPPYNWVHATDVYSSPESAVQAETLAEADGALVVQQKYRPKSFSMEGIIRRESRAELKAAIDEFKLAMAVKNQAFDVDEVGDGDIRRYLSYATNVIVARSKRNLSAAYSVAFICPDGVAWSVSSTALVSPTGITTSSLGIPITAGGTYKVEPMITLTMNTVTGGTGKTVTISNGTTLRGISVTRNWATGDVLEIDSTKMSVYVNNQPVDFTGQFPKWDVGAGELSYLDDLTTRDATLSASYTKRWL